METYDQQSEREPRNNTFTRDRFRSTYGFAAEQVSVGQLLVDVQAASDWSAREDHSRKMLSRALDLGTTVAFVGAGCSCALGYPNWAGLARTVLEECRSSLSAEWVSYASQLLAGYPKTDEILHILSQCKAGLGANFTHRVEQILGGCHPSPPTNPYDNLINLNIHRFVTTNFDTELEKALGRKLNLFPGKAEKMYGFTPASLESLARAPLSSLSQQEPIVFHCHGSVDDIDSLVLTEADYRRWYLSEDQPNVVEFRQTLEILFGSNPILFVGFGLSDDDLLRVLRTILANEPGALNRQLFAIMSTKDKNPNAEEMFHFELLNERYGIHVLHYAVKNPGSGGDWGLSEELDRIAADAKKHRERWLCKPRIRLDPPDQRTGKTYFHYQPDFSGGGGLTFPSVQSAVSDWVAELSREAQDRPKVLGVVGPGGSGKTTGVIDLINRFRSQGRFDAYFFWSSYYVDDVVTGIDSALRFLDPQTNVRKRRLERLSEQLESRNCLLVFDGVERLLREEDSPGEGVANSILAERFLRALASPTSKSAVVLTSRLWPKELKEFEANGIVKKLNIAACSAEDVEKNLSGSSIKRKEDYASLSSLLDGHLYGLVLAVKAIRLQAKADQGRMIDGLLGELSRRRPDERVSRMIARVVQDLDKDALGLLERLAVFMGPVSADLIEVCRSIIKSDRGSEAGSLESELENKGLLVPVFTELVEDFRLDETGGTSKQLATPQAKPRRYVVHPTVREYVFRRLHRAGGCWPNLSLAGATSATATVDPGPDGAGVLKELFETLCKASECADKNTGIELARYAFGVIRSRMTANTVPRWGSFSEYLRLLVRMADLTRNYSHGQWRHASKAEESTLSYVYDKSGILRPEELAWLYNEIGLAYYLQGSIVDSLGAWEQGYEINRLVDSDESMGGYVFQSNCNLGAANIQSGRLTVAKQYLQRALEINCRLGSDRDHEGRIQGYLALIDHLKGNFHHALDGYRAAIEKVCQSRNLRAQSIFLRHQADLQLKMDRGSEARESIWKSREAAEDSNHPDLVMHSRLSEAHWRRSKGDFAGATKDYLEIVDYARRKELKSLEADALSELSRLALDLGDFHTARDRAVKALHIANEHILGLRQTHGLVVLGLANVKTGQRDLGSAYLQQAIELGAKQGYLLRRREAERERDALGLGTRRSA